MGRGAAGFAVLAVLAFVPRPWDLAAALAAVVVGVVAALAVAELRLRRRVEARWAVELDAAAAATARPVPRELPAAPVTPALPAGVTR